MSCTSTRDPCMILLDECTPLGSSRTSFCARCTRLVALHDRRVERCIPMTIGVDYVLERVMSPAGMTQALWDRIRAELEASVRTLAF
jgi:molybdenum cofactor biosynthesis enzyme MoaA